MVAALAVRAFHRRYHDEEAARALDASRQRRQRLRRIAHLNAMLAREQGAGPVTAVPVLPQQPAGGEAGAAAAGGSGGNTSRSPLHPPFDLAPPRAAHWWLRLRSWFAFGNRLAYACCVVLVATFVTDMSALTALYPAALFGCALLAQQPPRLLWEALLVYTEALVVLQVSLPHSGSLFLCSNVLAQVITLLPAIVALQIYVSCLSVVDEQQFELSFHICCLAVRLPSVCALPVPGSTARRWCRFGRRLLRPAGRN